MNETLKWWGSSHNGSVSVLTCRGDEGEKKQRPDTQLRIRAFCPGIFAFLAVFRVVEKKDVHCEFHSSRRTSSTASSPGPLKIHSGP